MSPGYCNGRPQVLFNQNNKLRTKYRFREAGAGSSQNRRGEVEIAEAPLRPAERRSHGWRMAGFLARQDAEHRTILDRRATRRVAGRTPRITNSPGANLSQLAKRVEPIGPSTWMCELNLLTPTNKIKKLHEHWNAFGYHE